MPSLRLLALCCALAALSTGCATGLFGGQTSTREQAVRACSREVPADAVPYADAFSDCMERRGWTYAGPATPRG